MTAGAMTLVILIFAEVLPKTLAIARTDRFALFVARPLRGVVAVGLGIFSVGLPGAAVGGQEPTAPRWKTSCTVPDVW